MAEQPLQIEEEKNDIIPNKPKVTFNLNELNQARDTLPDIKEEEPNDDHEPLHGHKQIRSLAEIQLYLQHFVPQYTSAKTMINSLIFVIFPMLYNISFICYNFADHRTGSRDDLTDSVRIMDILVLYTEFIGLMIIFGIVIVSYAFGYYSTVIDTVYYIKSWSTFRLFYRFRPQSLYEYFSIFYGHHNHRQKETNSNYHQNWEGVIQELKVQIAIQNDKYVSIEQMTEVQDALQDELNKMKKVDDVTSDLDNQTSPQNESSLKASEIPTVQKVKQLLAWLLCFIISIICIAIGISTEG